MMILAGETVIRYKRLINYLDDIDNSADSDLDPDRSIIVILSGFIATIEHDNNF